MELDVKYPTLYKTKKKVLIWEIETFHHKDYSEYKITHGQKDGKLQTTSTKVTEGKNIGKANETSIQDQCDKEAEALHKRQIDRKGYTTHESVHQYNVISMIPRVMLAESFDDYGHKIQFPCLIQPKLDGIRCLANGTATFVQMLSRQQKMFSHLHKIKQELREIYKNRGFTFDGELYRHGYTFQQITSAVKRDEPNDLTDTIEYHVYDIISTDTNIDRYKKLDQFFKETDTWNYVFKHIKFVPTEVANSIEDIDAAHAKWTALGYEGIMIRNYAGLYKEDGRSQNLLKYKKFIDQEFPIVGAIRNKGKLENTCVFVCDHNGEEFKVMCEGSQEEREKLWSDWKNGKIQAGDKLTVKFFSWTSSDKPVPRFPIGVGVRNYE